MRNEAASEREIPALKGQISATNSYADVDLRGS